MRDRVRPLAVRLPNWVGDVCMALPALDLLRTQGFAVVAFGRPWAADLLAGLHLDVRTLPSGHRAAAAALRAAGCRRGLLLTNSFGSALAMRLAGLRATGYAGDGRRLLLGQAVRRGSCHEVEAFWRLACAVAQTHGPVPRRLGLPLTDSHRAQAAAALVQAKMPSRFIVLSPLAVGTAEGQPKEWPRFAALCRRLVARGDTVVACPGPGEADRCRAALPGATVLEGLGLGAYAAVLARAAGVVANDSGPLHLAAAVGAPVLGIFGVSDPARTRPWGPNGQVVGDGRGWPAVESVWQAVVRLTAGSA